MKDFLRIVKRNFMQPIVIAILLLACALLLLGEARDAWFVSFVIIVNTVVAIVQEVRARNALKKLELMNAPRARRLNDDGTVSNILFEELIKGDTIDIRMGDEIPADGLVLSSQGLEVDEGMLTGESRSVPKDVKTEVYASTSVVAGSAIIKVLAVGADSKVGTMTKKLKRYEPRLTPLQKSIANLIAAMTYGALALAILISVSYTLMGQDPVRTVKTITTAAVTVVPEGLLLASTLLLAFGSLRLVQAKVLPQQLSAIESMALLNVLCVDKTGTLTSDLIKFEDYISFNDENSNTRKDYIGIAALETSGGNATGDAVIAGMPVSKKYEVVERLAFSSERKYSGLRLKVGQEKLVVLIGAPEFLSRIAPLNDKQSEQLSSLTADGKRVLLTAIGPDSGTPLRELKNKSLKASGLVVLSNELRQGVEKTVAYLKRNGVDIRVISGDNIETVKAVAKEAGITSGEEGAITGASLAKLKGVKWDKAVESNKIFARILPEQKEKIIDTFRKKDFYTGMIGDGVNDALALKKADMGIAMFAGATASRRVADIVLLNNSFNALPIGMKLGNRIMLAIEMITTLFFHKIIYAVILLFAATALGVAYPFEPRHVTFMNIFLVTMPTILWTLFPPIPTYKVSPKRFWWDTLAPVTPIAIITGFVVALSYLHLLKLHPNDVAGVATTTVLIATFFGVYLVFLIGKMFRVVNSRIAKLARILYVLGVVFMLIISFGFGFTRDFFDFVTPAYKGMLPLTLLIIFAVILQWIIASLVAKSKLKTK